jgi:hypothetical protein
MRVDFVLLLCVVALSYQDIIPRHRSNSPWPGREFDGIYVGTQRVSVITRSSDVVWAHLPWRRRDLHASTSTVIVTDDNGQIINNVIVAQSNNEFGDIIFQAQKSAQYEIYYLPYRACCDSNLGVGAWEIQYVTKDYSKVDNNWRTKYNLTDQDLPKQLWKSFPQASILGKQARTDHDEGYDMEIIATEEEKKAFIAKYSSRYQFLVFPKFIRNTTQESIRMPQLPYVYYKYGPQTNVIIDRVQQGQYAVIEIGIFPFSQMNNVQLRFQNLTSSKSVISSSVFEAIELGGVDMHGNPLKKVHNISKLEVGFITVGIDIPKNVTCGIYRSQIQVTSESLTNVSTIDLVMNISCSTTPIDPINDVWSLQRLKWLNSRIGIDDEFLPESFTPIQVHQNEINILNRVIVLNKLGLPDQLISNGNAILTSPIQFISEFDVGECEWIPGNLSIQKKSSSYATISANMSCSNRGLNVTLNGLVTYDGVIDYSIVVTTTGSTNVDVRDIRLQYEQAREFATFSSGQSWTGGYYRPTSYIWRDVDPVCKGDGVYADRCQGNQLWIGDMKAGLKIKLKGNTPSWDNPKMNWTAYGVNAFPRSWGNLDGSGGLKSETTLNGVTVTAFSGARSISSSESIEFRFNLVLTPVKPLDPVAHFNKQRYYHTAYNSWEIPNIDVLKYLGVNTVIFHQSNSLNARINYPTHPATANALRSFIKIAHERGLKVKVYATTREISNAIIEIWSLRNLDGEVFDTHLSYGLKGNAWLQEHLVSDYDRAWFTMEPNFEEDASIHILGTSDTGSRFANYYIESLRWMIQVLDIDGIYYDGLTLDYISMQRARKVFKKLKPDSYFDLDTNPLMFLELISNIDTLWIGEGLDLSLFTPDEWLIKMSGLPFGLYGEMLGGGETNKYRAMLFGMTNRCGFNGLDPNNNMVIWRLWDFFDIAHAEMIGWWDPNVPVRVTQQEDILKTTVYLHRGKMALIVIASWATDKTTFGFKYDWEALGIHPNVTVLSAPYMIGIQDYAVFNIAATDIPIMPSKGWFFILDQQNDYTKWKSFVF